MIHVPRTPEFSNCGNMNSISMHTSSVQDLDSMLGGRGRQRSHSYYSPEDKKNYGVQTETDQIYSRPRSRYVITFYFKTCTVLIQIMSVILSESNRHVYLSKYGSVFYCVTTELILNPLFPRSFYSYETSELHSRCETESFDWSSPLRQTTSSLHQHQESKKESKGDGAAVRVTSKKSKLNKHSLSRELSGTEIMVS